MSYPRPHITTIDRIIYITAQPDEERPTEKGEQVYGAIKRDQQPPNRFEKYHRPYIRIAQPGEEKLTESR